jgi:hypothetical protein
MTITWTIPLPSTETEVPADPTHALIILNQDFSFFLLERLWRICAFP